MVVLIDVESHYYLSFKKERTTNIFLGACHSASRVEMEFGDAIYTELMRCPFVTKGISYCFFFTEFFHLRLKEILLSKSVRLSLGLREEDASSLFSWWRTPTSQGRSILMKMS